MGSYGCFTRPFCGPNSDHESFVVAPELTEWSAEVHYMAGWVALSQDRTEDAMGFFGRVDDPYLLPSSQEVMTAIDVRDLPNRNRALAGVLAAIVPGSGHLYAGAAGQGVVSLLSTGLMGYLAWDAYSRDNLVQVALFSLSGAFSHVMSVNGAIESVDQFNDQQLSIWLADLEPAHSLSATLGDTEGESFELRLELAVDGDCEDAGPEWDCSSD